MTTTIEPSRSSLEMENLQELIDAESSAASLTHGYAQQYITPEDFAYKCAKHLAVHPRTVMDPQVGTGALLSYYDTYCIKFGVDIDMRLPTNCASDGPHVIPANCVKVWDIIEDLYPHLRFDCINSNPPFGRRWKRCEETIDSTKATWEWVTSHGRCGYFIANYDTVVKLGILRHPFVTDHWIHKASTLWIGVRDDLQIIVVFWRNTSIRITEPSELLSCWRAIRSVAEEERVKRPPFNIYLSATGMLRTYLSTRFQLKRKLAPSEIVRLASVDNAHPLSLCVEVHTRRLLEDLATAGVYTIQPEARKAIDEALVETDKCAIPILPCTSFETVAYADHLDQLECTNSVQEADLKFTAGRKYNISTGAYKFSQKLERTKVHFDENSRTTYTLTHECVLSGQDRFIAVTDDNGRTRRFMDRPDPANKMDLDERRLWDIFTKPVVRTVADTSKQQIAQNLAILRSCEMIAGYVYYPGQLHYLAHVGVKNAAIIAADTGAGKTLMALSLLAMKGPKRALIIAPQGTMRSPDSEDAEDGTDYNASQWITEIHKFAPYFQIWELFSEDDYDRICSLNGGQLPPGVYVSYYQAFFQNGARETAANSWDDDKLNKHMRSIVGPTYPPLDVEDVDKKRWCATIGEEKEGIRCIIEPCLSTKIGHLFDMVMVDEAQIVTNLEATVTQMLIRLQPKYRYALTATPIPNIVSNLFSLMGWLTVPEWYKGKRRNAAWPYAREEIGRFNTTFLSIERDMTQERMNREADPKWGGKCLKTSPIISSPARLLKLLKPTMAYISKEDCNPEYQPAKVIDVRVPMGAEQSELYKHFLDRASIPCDNALVRARKQVAYLRNICADPAGFRHGGPRVSSNMNPKTITGLELVRSILEKGEQVLCICARVGQTDTLQRRLVEAGVPIARIDSTIAPEQHSVQANLFKNGKARVMLMGIKCAAAHSFSQCTNMIIFSLEYSWGPLHQARGRVDRVNSPPGVTIWCILHKMSLEELMFDLVATKGDAATICLKGCRVPRDYRPVEAGEVLAQNIINFTTDGATPEADSNRQWPQLRDAISSTLTKGSLCVRS